jgi:hypothetical protein
LSAISRTSLEESITSPPHLIYTLIEPVSSVNVIQAGHARNCAEDPSSLEE